MTSVCATLTNMNYGLSWFEIVLKLQHFHLKLYIPVNQELTFSENLLFAQLPVAFSPVKREKKRGRLWKSHQTDKTLLEKKDNITCVSITK